MTRWPPHPDWEAQILAQLDEYAREYEFPMFDNTYFDTAEMRLTVLRSDDEWLVVAEQIAVGIPYGPVDSVDAYGNQLSRRGTLAAIELDTGLPIAVPVPLDGPERAEAARLFRELVAAKPRAFYCGEASLLALTDRAGAGLSVFLRLDGWQNPDLADDQLPSDVACFKSLAGAIAFGDPSLYECPEELWNTDLASWQR
jgi:hypothetical protein